jgi:spermidine synthase
MNIETEAADSLPPAALRSNKKILYGLTIFLSAFLLFQVEPLIAKIILPWFGGAAAVWTVCLLFFQTLLLLGYLYAHLLARRIGQRVQGWLHAVLLAASLLVLPILPKNSWKPLGPEHPALHILWVLALTVGLPFFLLSATSPLLQSWLANARRDSGVYRFYALSNTGSLLGLLSYPTLAEPHLSTLWQGRSWSIAYAAFAAACGAITFSRRGRSAPLQQSENVPTANWKTRALWFSLCACSSALLLAVTNHITQNIASVPFLWIIPLSLYMVTFIVCFGSSRWYPRIFFLRLLGVALGGMAYALSPSLASLPFWLMISLFCAGLFVCCMFCHGELARLKPDPSELTSFYLLSSLGSVAGAVFVAILAPQIFSAFYELHVALAGCVLLVVLVHWQDATSPFRRPGWRPAWLALNALAIAVIVSLAVLAHAETAKSMRVARNFYGVLRVSDEVAPNVVLLKGGEKPEQSEDSRFRRLTNGTISHGLQFLGPARRDQPTSYFGVNSGIGVALQAMAPRGPLHVGVIGLGVGTIAAYGRAGDEYTFYEINSLDLRIAQQDFRFLRDSKAHVSFELGDARLTLERQPPQRFDVFAVDAFSSDSIPVHLLTLEAFELYFRHLKPDGVLAVHISNQHLNLEPVVAAAASRLEKDAFVVSNRNDYPNGIFSATWVLLGSHETLAQLPAIEKAGRRIQSGERLKLWTDSYSSLFAVLK